MVGRLPSVSAIKPAVIKDFKGGLNTFDTPLNLSSRFATQLENLYPDTNGRLQIRFGTTLFSDLSITLGLIINCFYYNGFIVSVGSNGKITKTDAAGVSILIWSSTFSAALPGAPAAWSPTTFASFTQFAGKLVIFNGIDKPIYCDTAMTVRYVQDAGTGSNVNVPRARYGVTSGNYLVLAVTPTDSTTLYIGSKGSLGTFVGDPGVDNDAVNFVTSTYITQGVTAITGMATFRNRLVVTYREVTLSIELGTYAGVVHKPTVDDAIPAHGAASHRALAALGDDVLLLDFAGVSSLKRGALSNSLTPQRETLLIATDIQKALSILTPQQISDGVYCVHDRLSQHVLFFIPESGITLWDDALPWDDGLGWSAPSNKVFTYCYDHLQKFKAWTTFTQMAYQCGCRTEEGRVFLASAGQLFYYRNQFDRLHMDYSLPGSQMFSDQTLFTDGTGFIATGTFAGLPIPFTYMSPDSDFGQPVTMKYSKYLHVIMEGSNSATIQMFCDRFTQAPALSMAFSNTNEPSATNLLTIRPLNTEQLYAWPTKFNRARFKLTGTTTEYTSLVALGVMYLSGSIRR